MAERKRLLKLKDLKAVFHVPKYRELNVKMLWDKLRHKPIVRRYFPNYSNKGHPSRDYFFNVLNTIFPNSIKRLIIKVEALH